MGIIAGRRAACGAATAPSVRVGQIACTRLRHSLGTEDSLRTLGDRLVSAVSRPQVFFDGTCGTANSLRVRYPQSQSETGASPCAEKGQTTDLTLFDDFELIEVARHSYVRCWSRYERERDGLDTLA